MDSSLSTASTRLERKQKRTSTSAKRELRHSDRVKAKRSESRSLSSELKGHRVERERKLRRELDRLRKKKEEDIKRAADTEDPTVREEALEKIQHLHQLTAKSSSHVITLDDAAYKKYVLEGSRPYYVVVTFTALGAGTTCALCHEFQRSLAQVASQYYEDHPTVESFGESPPIFFVNVDAAKNREVFEAMKLSTAPAPIILPPRASSKPMKLPTVLTSTPAKQRYQLQARNHPHDIVMFIHKNSQQMITINYNAYNGEEIIIGVLAAATALFVLYRYFDQIVALRLNPNLRFMLCLLGWTLYMWCISGGMYNIIKGNIFAHTEKDRPTEYISNEPRDQYGAEGLILGFIIIAASTMLVICNLKAFEGTPQKPGAIKGKVAGLWATVSPVLRPEFCVVGMIFFWSANTLLSLVVMFPRYEVYSSFHWSLTLVLCSAVCWCGQDELCEHLHVEESRVQEWVRVVLTGSESREQRM